MLKNISPLISPDLLWVLAAMGHGDDLAVVDANHPAEKIASSTTYKKVIRLPGLTMGPVINDILTLYPLDTYVTDPVRRMLVVEDYSFVPPVQEEVRSILTNHGVGDDKFVGLERFEFYRQAAKAFAVVQVGDMRAYGCFLLRKGVIV